LADPIHACKKLKNNVTGAMVVAVRGKCPYLDKATNVSAANASAIIIVNSQEELYRVSLWCGVGRRGKIVAAMLSLDFFNALHHHHQHHHYLSCLSQ